MIKNKFIIIYIIIPLIIGTMIYALFRGIELIDSNRKIFPLISSLNIPDWIIYNLPDGLWLYAFLNSILLIWKDNSVSNAVIWLTISIILTYLSEIFQLYEIIPGTFDWNDIIFYSIAILIFIYQFQYKKQ